MPETRGAATIVDRVEGYGHADATDSNREDDGTWGAATEGTGAANTITATDASKEVAATRVARARAARKVAKAANHPDNVDRSEGYAANLEGSAQADPSTATADLGVATGSNTAHTTSDSEALATGRTADSRDTTLLNDDDAASRAESERASVRDRSSGWGHTDGSFSYRND